MARGLWKRAGARSQSRAHVRSGDGPLYREGYFCTCLHVGVPAKNGDIPNAYVKADKEAHLRIYLQLPRGMSASDSTLREHGATSAKELVIEIRKSLYGLKQAGWLWSQLLHSNFEAAGFRRCESGMCLYWKRDGPDLVFVGVYVDDLLATGASAAAVDRFLAASLRFPSRIWARSASF